MPLKQWVRWGTWPARIAGAVLIFYGAYRAIMAVVALNAPSTSADGSAGVFEGAFLISSGALVALLSWLTRRRMPIAAIAGQVVSFFAAGLIVVYALAMSVSGLPLILALAVGVCLLLAAGTALLGPETPAA